MIGLYLDSLTDAQRDRVIEAQDWTTTGGNFVDTRGRRCLCGHAHDWYRDFGGRQSSRERGPSDPRFHDGRRPVYNIYPEMVARFGLRRTVALIKARAARGNRIPTAAPARETVGAA